MLNSKRVNKYFYPDGDHAARRVVRHRFAVLSSAHPQHLPPEAWQDVFQLAPNEVVELTASELRHAGADGGEQWMLISFWSEGELK